MSQSENTCSTPQNEVEYLYINDEVYFEIVFES